MIWFKPVYSKIYVLQNFNPYRTRATSCEVSLKNKLALNVRAYTFESYELLATRFSAMEQNDKELWHYSNLVTVWGLSFARKKVLVLLLVSV